MLDNSDLIKLRPFTVCLTHLTHAHTHPHRYLVNVGCVKPLCDLLTLQNPRMVMITLEGIENILKIGQQDAVNNINPFATMVEEAYGNKGLCSLAINFVIRYLEHTQSHRV